MSKPTFLTVLASTALIAVATGCAGPSAGSVSGPVFSALTPSSDLVGTCPKGFWLEWIAEGDAAGDAPTGEEWGWRVLL